MSRLAAGRIRDGAGYSSGGDDERIGESAIAARVWRNRSC